MAARRTTENEDLMTTWNDRRRNVQRPAMTSLATVRRFVTISTDCSHSPRPSQPAAAVCSPNDNDILVFVLDKEM